ncbi:zinc ribbon domain-containing protein [Sulfurovum sp. XTW-4]|uniref:Zinc ribbon domain-containing protein n=1 Tax=Sulfurovum xiamenensis TaxID=3019066 RepID=A0ABT7QUJ7_9BACT|nr:zinc ribbon domain-containing protein [Sulfurovum xiamenensis]MDM5264763.1 zinc ribbon domain-containing protein [Sulfurovum xiamenensis]
MGMIKCKECKSEISNKAKTCPQCGAPVPQKTSFLTWIFLISIIAIFLIVTSGPNNKSSMVSSSENKEFAWVEKGKYLVRSKLKDSDSAKFRDIYFNKNKDQVPVACGEVNSKNGLGAFAGYERFISAGSIEFTWLESEVSDFGNIWNKLCVATK